MFFLLGRWLLLLHRRRCAPSRHQGADPIEERLSLAVPTLCLRQGRCVGDTTTVGFFASVCDQAPMAMIPIDDEVWRVVGFVGRRMALLRHIGKVK